jgi:peptidyl-prolyl cis-trans isomerase SurA
MALVTFLFRLFLVLAVLAPVPGHAATAPSTIDRILVVVNDDIITARDLEVRLESVRHRLTVQRVNLPPDEVLRRQVLERMISERLQTQLAKNYNITISDDQLDRAIRSIAEQQRKSPEEFRREAEALPGGLKTLRAEIRDQLLAQQLVEREINNRILVTDAEVEAFLAARRSRGGEIELNLSHILIALPESASSEAISAARQKAEKIHRELKQGADFSQLAVTHSQGQRALEGGGLGWKPSGQLPDLFVNAVSGLQPGEVSEVLRSPGGFHVLKLNDRRGEGTTVNVTQTRARHILIKISELVPANEARRRTALLRERLLAGEDFAKAARAQSEDIGSAANGGELGWMNPGQTVAEFEKVMNTLKPGELSEPVRSPFGYHLIEVLERRERDVSHERDVANARRQIHARKADERLEQWLRQLRDEAYVEYRNESGK